MIALYDTVKLKKDREDISVLSSDIGTVIDIVNHKGDLLFTVEFFNKNGESIDESIFVYFREDDLELVQKC